MTGPRFGKWLGRRVTVGTTTLHYLCGTWRAITDDERDAIFDVGGHEVRLLLDEIATVSDAPRLQAEFFK